MRAFYFFFQCHHVALFPFFPFNVIRFLSSKLFFCFGYRLFHLFHLFFIYSSHVVGVAFLFPLVMSLGFGILIPVDLWRCLCQIWWIIDSYFWISWSSSFCTYCLIMFLSHLCCSASHCSFLILLIQDSGSSFRLISGNHGFWDWDGVALYSFLFSLGISDHIFVCPILGPHWLCVRA